MISKRISTSLSALHILLGSLLAFCPFATADELMGSQPRQVSLVELEDADCAQKDGKLFALINSDAGISYEVWVDRWFLNVQTADHTRHILSPGQEPVALGCSQTRSGAQHWTIYSIKAIQH